MNTRNRNFLQNSVVEMLVFVGMCVPIVIVFLGWLFVAIQVYM